MSLALALHDKLVSMWSALQFNGPSEKCVFSKLASLTQKLGVSLSQLLIRKEVSQKLINLPLTYILPIKAKILVRNGSVCPDSWSHFTSDLCLPSRNTPLGPQPPDLHQAHLQLQGVSLSPSCIQLSFQPLHLRLHQGQPLLGLPGGLGLPLGVPLGKGNQTSVCISFPDSLIHPPIP